VTADLPMRLAEADVVTVDLLGTVLARNLCRHTDLHRLTQEIFNASDRYLSEEFAPRRVEAEALARKNATHEGQCAAPVTLEDIYENLADLMKLDPETTNRLAEAELEAEAAVLRPDPRGVRLVKLLADQGKPVIALCNSHLPRRFLLQRIEAAGMSQLSDLLISTADGMPHQGWDPWEVLAEQFRGRRIVHIGPADSIRVACSQGIAVFDLPDPIGAFRDQQGPAAVLNGPSVFELLSVNGNRLRNVQRSMVNAVVARRLADQPTCSEGYAFGYGALGPLLVGFVQWLHRAAIQSGCRRLRFSDPLDRLVGTAYRSWWGDMALPSTGARDPTARVGFVNLGWNEGSRSPAPHATVPGCAEEPTVNLSLGLSPEYSSRSSAGTLAAFIDGGRESQSVLYRELVAPYAAVLDCLLVASEDPERVELQRGASDFVGAQRAASAGLPTTVAILDGPTVCENMVIALNSPSSVAARLICLRRR